MNSDNNHQPDSIELPDPVNHTDPQHVPVSSDGKGSVEFGHINNPTQAPVSQPTSSTQQDDSALMADDVDLIEKAWVTKAKAIVSQTVNDPNLQTEKLSDMKAEYIKKRYNKDLKQDGDK